MLNTISLSGVKVVVFRDDLNHATVSGNKMHKLAPNIDNAKARGCQGVLSFGGPYSNHLHALAWASRETGLNSIGIVRGELTKQLTPTLADCENWGMRLIAIDRRDYRAMQNKLAQFSEPELLSGLNFNLSNLTKEEHKSTLVIPEGGSNQLAIASVSMAYRQVFISLKDANLSHAVCATGTGATLAGLYQAAPETIEVIGMQAVAEQHATVSRIETWLNQPLPRLCIMQGHLGRFGKITDDLNNFIEQFEAQHGIPLDPIYTGKAMYKLSCLIHQGYFKKTDKILFIHTGGLQGKRQ